MKLLMYCQNCQTIQERDFSNAKVVEKEAWPDGGDPKIKSDCVLVGGAMVHCDNCGLSTMNLRQRSTASDAMASDALFVEIKR